MAKEMLRKAQDLLLSAQTKEGRRKATTDGANPSKKGKDANDGPSATDAEAEGEDEDEDTLSDDANEEEGEEGKTRSGAKLFDAKERRGRQSGQHLKDH